MHSEAMQSLRSFSDTGTREENKEVSANTFFFGASEFSQKKAGEELDMFCCYSELCWQLSGVSGEKLISELSWLCQPC